MAASLFCDATGFSRPHLSTPLRRSSSSSIVGILAYALGKRAGLPAPAVQPSRILSNDRITPRTTRSCAYSYGRSSGLAACAASPDCLIIAPAGAPAATADDTMQHMKLYCPKQKAPTRSRADAKARHPVTADASSSLAYLTYPFCKGITVTDSRGLSPHSAVGFRRRAALCSVFRCSRDPTTLPDGQRIPRSSQTAHTYYSTGRSKVNGEKAFYAPHS